MHLSLARGASALSLSRPFLDGKPKLLDQRFLPSTSLLEKRACLACQTPQILLGQVLRRQDEDWKIP